MTRFVEQSGYIPAIRLERIFSQRAAGVISFVLGVSSLLTQGVAIYFLNEAVLGVSMVFSSSFLVVFVYWLFIRYLKSEHDYSPDEIATFVHEGMYGALCTFFVSKLLLQSTKGDYVVLRRFFRILLTTDEFQWMLERLNISKKAFLDAVVAEYSDKTSESLEHVLEIASAKMRAANHSQIRYADFLVGLYEVNASFQKILFTFDITPQDIAYVAYWQRRNEETAKRQSNWWSRERLSAVRGIGKGWSGGYTVRLDRYATDVTAQARRAAPEHLYGRRRYVELLSRLLVQGQGNAAVVGMPGVGKRTLVQMFAKQVYEGRVPHLLQYKRVLQIDSSSIISGTSTPSQVLDKVRELFGEAYRAENVILAIVDIDAFFEDSLEAGKVNATEALIPFLESRLQVIGLTAPDGYRRTIGKNAKLGSLFGKLELTEPRFGETLYIVQDEARSIEKRSELFFTHQALTELVSVSTKFIQQIPQPEKAIELLESVALASAEEGVRTVLPAHVHRVVSQQTKIPVGTIEEKEKDILINLEEMLKKRIVGQEAALEELGGALRRARAGVGSEKKPIGSFLFLGPTGVGKTETVKALASVYFGSQRRIIRFDMSEYQERHSIDRLIGDIDTQTPGALTEAVIENPFSLILLDELEKAHPRVLDIFLQVFDEGRLTDTRGRVVDFTNTMIIATSNAGAEKIRQMVKEGIDPAKQRDEILDEVQHSGIFRPEFINRFDAIVIYKPLNKDELTQVAKLLLEELNERLAVKDVSVKITDELARAIAENGYSAEYGARPLRRYIQQHIENYIAEQMLLGQIKRGDEVEIVSDALEKAE